MEKIGMIGTGAMGLALLERLKLAGEKDVVCYDAAPTALASATTLGCRAAASAKGVRAIDACMTGVPNTVRTGHDSMLNRWQRTFDPSGQDPLPRSGRNVLNKDIPLVAELARILKTDTPITRHLAAAAEPVVAANERRNQ